MQDVTSTRPPETRVLLNQSRVRVLLVHGISRHHQNRLLHDRQHQAVRWSQTSTHLCVTKELTLLFDRTPSKQDWQDFVTETPLVDRVQVDRAAQVSQSHKPFLKELIAGREAVV